MTLDHALYDAGPATRLGAWALVSALTASVVWVTWHAPPVKYRSAATEACLRVAPADRGPSCDHLNGVRWAFR